MTVRRHQLTVFVVLLCGVLAIAAAAEGNIQSMSFWSCLHYCNSFATDHYWLERW